MYDLKRLATLFLIGVSFGSVATTRADEKQQIGYIVSHWSTLKAVDILLYSTYVTGVRDTYADFNVARRKGLDAAKCVARQNEAQLLAEDVRSYKEFHLANSGSMGLRDWTIFRLNEICDLGGDS